MYKMIDAATLSNFRRFMASGIPLTEFGPQGAFDAKPKARDADPEAVARGLANMLMALKEQLGDSEFRALCDQVCDGEEADEPEAEAEAEDDDPSTEFTSPAEREAAAAKDKKAKDKKAKDARKAKDEPEPFKGEPETKAMDAAADPRFAFVADMRRVKPSQPGAAYGDRSSQAPRSSATSASFEKLYPDAANIKVR